ncbi:MAG: hypothetical protein IRZ07_00120 [Microbispora sp.]|nr:hypothetical protein [Microbispora sp.]
MQPIRLTPAHKMMASAVLVAVVIVGGASVTAAAFAGRLDDVAKAGGSPTAEPGHGGSSRDGSKGVAPADADRRGVTGPQSSPEIDPDVFSKMLTDDPDQVSGYWTPGRMKSASPMPMPEVSVTIVPD